VIVTIVNKTVPVHDKCCSQSVKMTAILRIIDVVLKEHLHAHKSNKRITDLRSVKGPAINASFDPYIPSLNRMPRVYPTSPAILNAITLCREGLRTAELDTF